MWRGLYMRRWGHLSPLQEDGAVSQDTRVHDLGSAHWLTVPASINWQCLIPENGTILPNAQQGEPPPQPQQPVPKEKSPKE